MINRAAIILKCKAAAIRWLNEADPIEETSEISTEEANDDRTVYLISDTDGDTEDTVERWIKDNYKILFETELAGWYTDPSLWPQNITLKLFREWFEVECHTEVIDTADGSIYEDDI